LVENCGVVPCWEASGGGATLIGALFVGPGASRSVWGELTALKPAGPGVFRSFEWVRRRVWCGVAGDGGARGR
jgi:hypothetical protein